MKLGPAVMQLQMSLLHCSEGPPIQPIDPALAPAKIMYCSVENVIKYVTFLWNSLWDRYVILLIQLDSFLRNSFVSLEIPITHLQTAQ